MSWIKSSWPLYLLILFGFWIFIFSIFDIVFDKDWINIIMAMYVLIIVLVFFIIFLKSTRKTQLNSVKEFEKKLKGGLYHFKCPSCQGIFAVKKSKRNDKKPVKMNCPDCGKIATIPPKPVCIIEEIPEKKSVNVNFRCNSCGEGITVWAEGAELHKDMNVYSCPFCGEKKEMVKI